MPLLFSPAEFPKNVIVYDGNLFFLEPDRLVDVVHLKHHSAELQQKKLQVIQ